MQSTGFLKMIVYPLIMRFFVVLIVAVVLSLGMALIAYALDDTHPATNSGANHQVLR